MKSKAKKLRLLTTAILSSLGLAAYGGSFTGDFGASHNYRTQGAVGTGWEGVELNTGGVTAWSSAAGTLTITNAGGNVRTGSWRTSQAPSVWKTLTGDFTNTVQVSAIQISEWNTAGLMIVDPATGDYVTCALFGLPYYATAPVLSCWNGVEGTTPFGIDGGTGPNNEFNGSYHGPYWLRLVRSADAITGYLSTNGTDWAELNYNGPISGSITPSTTPVRVGLFSATYSSVPGMVQFQNYSLNAAALDLPQPANSVSGLTSTSNPDGTVSLSWTAAAGSDGSIVVMRQGGVLTYQPVSGVAYTGNEVFGSGDTLGGSNYVVYAGAGTSVVVTNLVYDNYSVAVYPYSTAGGTPGYKLSGPATTTVTPTPPLQGLALTAATTDLALRPVIPAVSQLTLTATYPAGTQDVTTGMGATYVSSAPAVATVNANGLVTALALGDATITATFGGSTATLTFHVVAPSYTVNTGDLYCSVVTDSLPPAGSNITSWTNQWPADGGAFFPFRPTTATRLAGVAFEKNVRLAATGFVLSNAYTATGYDLPASGGAFLNPIACDGASVVAVVKPFHTGATDPWHSFFCVFHDQLMLGIHDSNNELQAFRNGTLFNTGVIVPDNQTTIVSFVAQNDGSFQMFTNGILAYSTAATSSLTQLTPGTDYYRKMITIGRNNQYDGWSCFNGDIGDVYFYTKALSADNRMALEDSLMSKFILAATNGYTITATAGANGSITPAGNTFVLQGYDQTFSFVAADNYKIGNVQVDGASLGPVFSYTFTSVSTNHTIAVSFVPSYNCYVTASAGTGGAISPSGTITNMNTDTPTFTVTANPGYKIASVMLDGVSQGEISKYTFAPLTTNHTLSVSFAPIGWPLPNSDQLILAAVTDGFTHSNGAAIGTTWPTLVPAAGPSPINLTLTGGTAPTVALVNGVNYMHSARDGGFAGYQYYPGSGYSTAIPSSGASVVAVVKPTYTGTSSPGWDSVCSVFSGQFGVGVDNATGQINVSRNNRGNAAIETGCYIPFDQITVLSLVMQTNGNFILYTNGIAALTNTAVSSFALTPGSADWQQRILVGRRNQYDGWTTFNGEIGDVFLYRTALSDASRQAVESHLMSKFIYSATNIWTVTASAGANGSIDPSGITSVNQGNDLSYTITPATDFVISSVLVDGVNVGTNTTYTFLAVNTNHTISATFQSATMATNPTNITYSVSGSTLTLSWPADHLGWILQTQTNTLSVGLSSNWVDVAGSDSLTSTNIPVNRAVPTMFYRLRKP